MKRLVIVGVAVLLAQSANAADLPIRAPVYKAPAQVEAPTWTGFYIGASVGGRWADTTAHEDSVTINGAPQSCLAGFPCVSSEQLNGAAFRFGGYLGYNWQVASAWVIGVEADASWANQTTTNYGMGLPGSINGFLFMIPGNIPNGPGDSFSVSTKWDASARARLGYLVTPSVLLYVTGGAAWLNFDSTSSCALAPVGSCASTVSPLSITNSSTKIGWTIGAGAETRLWANWFARIEYRYADFGTATYTNQVVNAFGGRSFTYLDTYDVHIATHTALLGLAYKF
jgi:outer membrane immunogenic protein